MQNTYNIEIEQGAEFRRLIEYQGSDGNPVDLTGYSAAMMVRNAVDDTDPIVSINSAGTGTDGVITIDALAGTIDIWIFTAKTTTLTPGEGIYDIELTQPDNEVIRLVQGKVQITAEVTR